VAPGRTHNVAPPAGPSCSGDATLRPTPLARGRVGTIPRHFPPREPDGRTIKHAQGTEQPMMLGLLTHLKAHPARVLGWALGGLRWEVKVSTGVMPGKTPQHPKTTKIPNASVPCGFLLPCCGVSQGHEKTCGAPKSRSLPGRARTRRQISSASHSDAKMQLRKEARGARRRTSRDYASDAAKARPTKMAGDAARVGRAPRRGSTRRPPQRKRSFYRTAGASD